MRRRQTIIIAVLGAITLFTSPVFAASAAINNAHLVTSDAQGAPTVTSYPSGQMTVFFRYTVTQADPSGSTSGELLLSKASGTVVWDVNITSDLQSSGPKALDLVWPSPPGSAWPDGGYCVVVKIAGAATTASGTLPLAFTVGNAPMPTCTNPTAVWVSRVRVSTSRHVATIRWRAPLAAGLSGFDVYRSGHRMNAHIVPVHPSPAYVYRVHRARGGGGRWSVRPVFVRA